MKTQVMLVVAVVTLSLVFAGCKKREVAEDLQEPMTMASLTNMAVDPGATAVIVPATSKVPDAPAAAQPPPNLEPLPPSGPYKPSVIDIQTALKNAGLYTGAIDGKTGPLTKMAIEEFQKANNLKVDGKVGPQTWGLLSKQLAAPTTEPAQTKKQR